MINAMLSGRVHSPPSRRISNNGKNYALVKIWVSATEGHEMFASAIAFADEPFAALMELKPGDAISISGPLKVGTWQDRNGKYHPSLDIEAIKVITFHQLTKKREANWINREQQYQEQPDQK